MDDKREPAERRVSLAMRAAVDAALELGAREGFVEAADFLHAARVSRPVAIRVLATLAPTGTQDHALRTGGKPDA